MRIVPALAALALAGTTLAAGLAGQVATAPAASAVDYVRYGPQGFFALKAAADATGPTLRVAGRDRYDTAAQAYRLLPAGSRPNVVIASGESFPDALTASSAGVVSGYVLLLTQRDRLPDATVRALQDNPPRDVVVAGGTGAVSEAVLAQLSALPRSGTIRRVAGANRYDTAVRLHHELQVLAHGRQDYGCTAWVVSGESFPDALPAGAAAKADYTPAKDGLGVYTDPTSAWGRAPLLLTAKDRLPASTLGALRDPAACGGYGYPLVRVVGGTGVVSTAVEQQIRAAMPSHVSVTRWSGPNRYATATSIIALTWRPPADGFLVTSGESFPDAVVAGSYTGYDTPILLTRARCTPRETRTALDSSPRIDGAFTAVVGGLAVAADPVSAPVCP